MTAVPPEHVLEIDEFADPVLWLTQPLVGAPIAVDVSDEVMDRYLGEGSGNAIKSFGHDPVTGVHFLLTRKGTTVHTDKAYLRYSHQLVIRNDGNRLRGLARYDKPTKHPMLVPGTLYLLDTHSPHQGIYDERYSKEARGRGMKAVIAVDRSTPLDPGEALALISTYLDKQMADFPFDPKAPFVKWKEPARVAGKR